MGMRLANVSTFRWCWALAAAPLIVGCTSENESYCDEQKACASGYHCELARGTCQRDSISREADAGTGDAGDSAAASDAAAPEGDGALLSLASSAPPDDAGEVDPYRPIVLTFSQPIDPSSATSSSVLVTTEAGDTIEGALTVDGATLTFTPAQTLPFDAVQVVDLPSDGLRVREGKGGLSKPVRLIFRTRRAAWRDEAPETLYATLPRVSAITAAVDERGNAFAGWQEHSSIWVRRAAARAPGWGHDAARIDTAQQNGAPTHPKIVVGPRGRALVAWTESGPDPTGALTDRRLLTRRYDPESSWSTTAELAGSAGAGQQFGGFSIALDGASRAWMLWQQHLVDGSGGVNVWGRTFSWDSGWSQTVERAVSFGSPSLRSARWAVNRQGIGVACWVDEEAAPPTLWARRVADGRWLDTAFRLTEAEQKAQLTPACAVNGAGRIAAAWARPHGTSGQSDLVLSELGSDGAWSSPEVVTTTAVDETGYPTAVQLNLDGSGAALVVWAGKESSIMAAYRASPAGVPTVTRLDDSSHAAGAPVLLGDGATGALVVWRSTTDELVSASYTLRAKSFGPSGWGETVTLGRADRRLGEIEAAMSPAGHAIVLWTDSDPEDQAYVPAESRLLARRLE